MKLLLVFALVCATSTSFAQADGIGNNIQVIRDLFGMKETKADKMDGDIKIIADSLNTVQLSGDNCVVDIESKKQTRTQDGRQWNVVELNVAVKTSDGKSLAFVSDFDPDKSGFADKKKRITFSQSITPKRANALFERGYYTQAEYESNREHSGSPEGDFATAMLVEGGHALTGGLLRSYLDQTVQFDKASDGSVESVSVKVENKKLTCKGI